MLLIFLLCEYEVFEASIVESAQPGWTGLDDAVFGVAILRDSPSHQRS